MQVLLSAQVADLYFAYRTTQLRIEMTRHNVGLQKRSLEITQQIFEAGEDSELDVQQAKTQYLSTLAVDPGPGSDVDQAAQRPGGAPRSNPGQAA